MFITLKLLFIDQRGKLFHLIASNTDYPGRLNVNFKINSFSNLAHTFSKLMEQRASKVIVEVHKKVTIPTLIMHPFLLLTKIINKKTVLLQLAKIDKNNILLAKSTTMISAIFKDDDKWYLIYSYNRNKCNPYHNGYLPLCAENVTMALHHLPPEIDQFIIHHLKENVHPTTIARLILQSYGEVVTEMAIY